MDRIFTEDAIARRSVGAKGKVSIRKGERITLVRFAVQLVERIEPHNKKYVVDQQPVYTPILFRVRRELPCLVLGKLLAKLAEQLPAESRQVRVRLKVA